MDQRFLEPRIGKIQKRGQRFRTGDELTAQEAPEPVPERKTSDEMIIEMAQSAAEPPQSDVSSKNPEPEAESEVEPEAEFEVEPEEEPEAEPEEEPEAEPEAETEPEDEAYEDEREYFEEEC